MGLLLEWTNECSKSVWFRGSMYYDGIAEAHMTQMPLDQMQKLSGSATMQMAVTGQDAMNMGVQYCTWQTWLDPNGPVGNFFWFSVKLTQPFNLFHAGPSASWQLATGVGPYQQPGGNSDTMPASSWRTVVNEVATPYILNADPNGDNCPKFIKVLLTPKAGGEDLSVSIVMSDS